MRVASSGAAVTEQAAVFAPEVLIVDHERQKGEALVDWLRGTWPSIFVIGLIRPDDGQPGNGAYDSWVRQPARLGIGALRMIRECMRCSMSCSTAGQWAAACWAGSIVPCLPSGPDRSARTTGTLRAPACTVAA